MLVNKLALGCALLSVIGSLASVTVYAQTKIVSDQGGVATANHLPLDITTPDSSAPWVTNQLIVKFKGSAPFVSTSNGARQASARSGPSVAAELLSQHRARVL